MQTCLQRASVLQRPGSTSRLDVGSPPEIGPQKSMPRSGETLELRRGGLLLAAQNRNFPDISMRDPDSATVHHHPPCLHHLSELHPAQPHSATAGSWYSRTITRPIHLAFEPSRPSSSKPSSPSASRRKLHIGSLHYASSFAVIFPLFDAVGHAAPASHARNYTVSAISKVVQSAAIASPHHGRNQQTRSAAYTGCRQRL